MKRIILAMLLLPLIFIACNRGTTERLDQVQEVTISELPKNESDNLANEAEVKEPPLTANDARGLVSVQDDVMATTPAPATTRPATPVNVDWDKKIIKTANVRLEVKSYDNYSRSVRNTIRKYGGYIAKEDNSNTEEKSEAVMTIRVPVEFFEPLINDLPGSEAKQLERNINTEEVTGQIIDTKARLETRKATRAKYLEFLKQANKVEDVLKVQAEINDIQEDIESADGRLAQLTNEARYSTINLTFFEPKAGYDPSNEPGYGSRLANAFINGGKWFADLFIGLLSIWPLYLFVFLAYIVFKRVRRPRVIKKFE